MNLDTALLAKYSKAGPRYTSYPTAPYFAETFGEREWLEELQATQDSGRDVSLYAHIPFCDSLCWYCGCNMVATRDYSKALAYLDVLEREIARVAGMVRPGRVAHQLHWGGGTPTFLRPAEIRRLARFLHRQFTIAADAEISCEIDPRELTREHVTALKESGFNRVSLGVQDLNPAVQKTVNRVQPESLIREVYGWLREAGFQSINLDLMVGLPHQTEAGFADTLDRIIAMQPDRLAVFNYAHVPWMKKHQKLIPVDQLPDVATKLRLQKLIMERLHSAGYVYVGMDHFARPTDEMVLAQQHKTLYRNFQGYTTHKASDLYAFGVSSISQTDEVFVQNTKNMRLYREQIEAGHLPIERGLRVTREDKLRRDAISRLMCDLEIDRAAFGAEWGIDFDRHFADALADLEPMQADGLVQLTPERVVVTELGRIFLRNLAMPFDAYLRQSRDDGPRFSKTI